MSDWMKQPASEHKLPKHDSTDDFEHLEHELQHQQKASLLDLSNPLPVERELLQHDGLPSRTDLLDTSVPEIISSSNNGIIAGNVESDLKPVPATPPPSADFEKFEANAEGGAHHQVEPTSFGTGKCKDELEARIREQLRDVKAATMSFMEMEMFSERPRPAEPVNILEQPPQKQSLADESDEDDEEEDESVTRSEPSEPIFKPQQQQQQQQQEQQQPEVGGNLLDFANNDEDELDEEFSPDFCGYDSGDIKSSILPEPEKSPELDFVKDEIIVHETRRMKPAEEEPWNVLETSEDKRFEEKQVLDHVDEPPSKPLPPLPQDAAEQDLFDDFGVERAEFGGDKSAAINEFLMAESKSKAQISGGETDEFESEPEPSPAHVAVAPPPPPVEIGDVAERKVYCPKPSTTKNVNVSARAIFSDLGIDAWFNPERLNPKVASLIYWRDPKKSGIVFGAILGVLLSLAYFSLISVVAYTSLLTLTCTVAFRIYKTVQQAIQKTSDGHPFKEFLEIDLALPNEKVHEVVEIAVANGNAAVSELRRLFLVEDFVDSLKFGFLMWSLTYLGSWFNGMTLIIIGFAALFSLPKIYETNKTQIDANLAVVQGKINEITSKVKAALPCCKKVEPTKEE